MTWVPGFKVSFGVLSLNRQIGLATSGLALDRLELKGCGIHGPNSAELLCTKRGAVDA